MSTDAKNKVTGGKHCAECGALKLPDDQREWGYGFTDLQSDNSGRFYICPDCAEGAKQN